VEANFKIGDQVTLKSGSVIMTVERVSADGIACVWAVDTDIRREVFVAATLKLYEYVRSEVIPRRSRWDRAF
jgi:uncharacterized protein YodC (DUF2158 family)